jgi:hypothetical protein
LAYALNPGGDGRALPARLRKAVPRRRLNYLKRSSYNQP